jgi:monoamine oxidase
MSVIIIGGGVSGLVLGYNLQKANIPFKILESQNRLGGRIMTILGKKNTPMELGATWFADYHHHLIDLLHELQIGYFPQHTEGVSLFQTRSYEPPQKFYIPPSDGVSYRIKGGTSSLINALEAKINPESILLNTTVSFIEDNNSEIIVTDKKGQIYNAKKVIISIPPQLVSQINFIPELSKELINLLPNIHTWMSGSIKFAIEFKKPFWLENGYSGTIFSQTGMAVEVYDQSNFEQNKFALVGFLSGISSRYTFAEREKIVSEQIKQMFGDIVTAYVSYTDKIWNDRHITSPKEIQMIPHQNNGHSLLNQAYYHHKLFFSGAEISKTYSGYMDGAIFSAKEVAKIISQ